MSLQTPLHSTNFTANMETVANATQFNTEVASALADAVPILIEVAIELGTPAEFFFGSPKRTALVTK